MSCINLYLEYCTMILYVSVKYDTTIRITLWQYRLEKKKQKKPSFHLNKRQVSLSAGRF